MRKVESVIDVGARMSKVIKPDKNELVFIENSSFASHLPKTAINFHKMKKGLYLNTNSKKKDYINFLTK